MYIYIHIYIYTHGVVPLNIVEYNVKGSIMSNQENENYTEEGLTKETSKSNLSKECAFYLQLSLSFTAQFLFVYGVVLQTSLAKRPIKMTCERNVPFIHIFLSLLRHSLCLDMESFLPMSWRQRIFERFRFDEPLPFSLSDLGPAGGIQVCVYA